ncbi:hypothetical protein DMUE_2157 [Dictyocoela muelleri]|nr:hypothetical protein DMUE_2157 [Dictyocoela muelleri]
MKKNQFNQHNSYKSINHTSLNKNTSSNSHFYIRSQNNHNNSNQVLEDDEFYQYFSKDKIDEKYNEQSKHPQNEKNLSELSFDHSDLNIFQFDEISTNEDILEIQRNANFDEIFKFIERDQELIKEENEKSLRNITPLKRLRIDSSNLNLNLTNTSNHSNDMITHQSGAIILNTTFQRQLKP